jgi:copper resistance protein C
MAAQRRLLMVIEIPRRAMTHRIARSAAALAAAASLALPAGAAAHAGIKSRTPKAGSTVSRSLGKVRVTFKERVRDAHLSVKSEAGAPVSLTSGKLNKRKTRVKVRLRPGLSAGRYTASVTYLARDRHAETKTWRFRLR